jgi:hypothetical protein
MDKGYDGEPMYETCESRGIRPAIALKETPAVKAGKHKPPTYEHGEWTFAGSDAKRGASKWRCPTGECQPASVWIEASRLHPLIPHGTERWKFSYKKRTALARIRSAQERLRADPTPGAAAAARHAARQPDYPGPACRCRDQDGRRERCGLTFNGIEPIFDANERASAGESIHGRRMGGSTL